MLENVQGILRKTHKALSVEAIKAGRKAAVYNTLTSLKVFDTAKDIDTQSITQTLLGTLPPMVAEGGGSSSNIVVDGARRATASRGTLTAITAEIPRSRAAVSAYTT